MTTRQVNLALWTLAAALSAGAAAALPLGFLLPDLPAAGDGAAAPRPAAAPAGPAATLPPLSEFERVWANPLRRPLQGSAADPSGVADSASPPPPPGDVGPALTLVGTIGESVAMLRTTDGSVEARAAGESVGGAEILSIRRSHVVLRYNGRTVTLDKPAEPAARP